MIGIVIVSHSRQISNGLKRMAEAMCREEVPIVSAGGMGEPDDLLGTDALRIRTAIEQVLGDDGALVFADIGAARLNAETAIDLLDEDRRAIVRFCDAPLVEGVLSATVQAAGGADIDEIAREARRAFRAPDEPGPPPAEETPPHSAAAIRREYRIDNRLGLHARPAARFVSALNARDCDVRVRNVSKAGGWVNAKSLNRVLTLEVVSGERIGVSADGADAERALGAIEALVDDNFGEGVIVSRDRAPAPAPAAPSPIPAVAGPLLEGIPISPGYAVAAARVIRKDLPEVAVSRVDDAEAEIARLDEALHRARDEIRDLVDESRDALGDYDARIFETHLLHLEDPEIAGAARSLVRDEGLDAEAAWRRTVAILIDAYAGLENKLLGARGDDLADVAGRVLRILTGAEAPALRVAEPAILCFHRLAPSDVLGIDLDHVRGLCVETGSKTAHAGILAAGLPIPVVFAVGPALRGVTDGTRILLDGKAGTVNIAPDAAALEEMEKKRDAWQARAKAADAVKHRPAVTRDGAQRRVAANIAAVEEADVAVASGAEEIGLFRTEFLYMNQAAAPDEDEQAEIYARTVSRLGGRPLVIRTMDIGGDKPVPCLDRPPEANPNLGWRGLRFGLDNPGLLQDQLRAALRASARGPVRIMFPMVSTLGEVAAARAEIDRAKEALESDGRAFDRATEVGIMIEVPAAAEMADVLAPHVDFFSIGTNDLTQYVMAADRGNKHLAELFDPFHPAVLRAIRRTIVAARATGIRVGMCGAMAGDPMATPVLLGLGLDEFSMTANRIPEFKLDFGKLSFARCEELALETLTLPGAGEVRRRVATFLETMSNGGPGPSAPT